MPIVGLKDNVLITGNVTTSNVSNSVSGFDSQFLIEVSAGYYMSIAGNKYKIDNVVSNSEITLSGNCKTNSDNVKCYMQTGPKFVDNVTENVYSIDNIYAVDLDEVNVPENQEKGINSPGWSHFNTWTGGHGQARYRYECLVAMSKSFTAGNIGDAADDSILLDTFLYFTEVPDDISGIDANSNVTFQVSAFSLPDGESISYQWYESPNNIVFATISDGGVYSGATSNTLEISNVDGLNAYYYYVEISSDAANTNTSSTISIETN